jgi:hypothetical protein
VDYDKLSSDRLGEPFCILKLARTIADLSEAIQYRPRRQIQDLMMSTQ